MTAKLEFRSVAGTHVGLVRATNEDAFVAKDGGLWAVADGLGGHAAGEVASGIVASYLNAVSLNCAEADLEGRTHQALQEAHQEISRRNSEVDQPTDMASTVAVLGMNGGRYFCVWAGDSRIYRLRQQELSQLTRDHRLVQELIDAGAIEEPAALSRANRNVITRAIGIDTALKLDRAVGDLLEGDIFILVTDGVTDLCSSADIANILMSTGLQESGDALVSLCVSRGAPDNLTFVVVAAVAVFPHIEET